MEKYNQSKNHFVTKSNIFGIALIVLMLTIGFYASLIVKQKTESELRMETMMMVKGSAETLDPADLMSLSASPADNNNPVYHKLRQQFANYYQIIKHDGLTGIYGMILRNEKIIFTVDSWGLDERLHSEPGDVYQLPPVELRWVFARGMEAFTVPYTDEFGSWFSILIPVKDPATGQVIQVIGADFDKSFYQQRILQSQINVNLIAATIALLIGIIYFYVLRILAERRRIRIYLEKEEILLKEKDELISVTSHELRTPATAIKYLLEAIMDGDYGQISESLKSPLGDLEASVDRLIRLLNDLLDAARIEAGRIKFILSEYRFGPLVRDIIKDFSVMASSKNITIEEGEIFNGPLFGDADKITQILNNLIGNSLKFTDQGKIRIYTASNNSNPDLVNVYVEDTGVGMSPEDAKKLFGKFQQMENQQGRLPGTGLGLYVSRGLAQKMGGNLWLEKTTVNKGTIFGLSVVKAVTKTAQVMEASIESATKQA